MRRQTNASDIILNGDTIAVRQIRPTSGNIQLLGNTTIIPPSSVQTTSLRVVNQAQTIGYNITFDEVSETISIKKFDNKKTVFNIGYLYDSIYNPPQVNTDNPPQKYFYISQVYNLPSAEHEANLFLQNNPGYCLVLSTGTDTSFTLPTLLKNGDDDYRLIQISNVSTFNINIMFENKSIIEMYQERISCVWIKKANNEYTWMYIP